MDSWTPCLEFRLSKSEVGPRDVHFGECPRWCMDPSPFGPSAGLTKLTHVHANRFKTLPRASFSVGWWLHTKTQSSWCHSAGDTVQASAWSGDCKGDVDSPSSSLWRVWQTFGAVVLRWHSQISIERQLVCAACYLPRWSRLGGQGESTPFRKMRGQ